MKSGFKELESFESELRRSKSDWLGRSSMIFCFEGGEGKLVIAINKLPNFARLAIYRPDPNES